MKKYGDTEPTENMTEEQKKEKLEEQSNMYFQQYLAAQQGHDFEKALSFILQQTECLQKLHGVRSHRVCSNLFLTAQCQLRTQKF